MNFVQLLRLQWDRTLAALALIGAVVALVAGYRGVSGKAFFAQEVPYLISGGVTAVLLLGIAGVLYLSADLRDQWRKLADISDTLDAMHSLDKERAELALDFDQPADVRRQASQGKRRRGAVDASSDRS